MFTYCVKRVGLKLEINLKFVLVMENILLVLKAVPQNYMSLSPIQPTLQESRKNEKLALFGYCKIMHRFKIV